MEQIVTYLLMVQKIIKLQANDSEIAATPLCLGNISEDFSFNNMKRAGLNGHVYDCSVDYDPIAVDDTLEIHKHLKKKNDIVSNGCIC